MNTDYPNCEAGYCQVKGKDCFVCGAAGEDSCRLRSGAARLDRDMLDKAMQREKTITRLETELAMLRAMSIAL